MMLHRKFFVHIFILTVAVVFICFICVKRSFFIENYIYTFLLLITGVSDVYLNSLEKRMFLENDQEVKSGSGFIGYLHLMWAICFILLRPFQLFSNDRLGYILSVIVAIVAGIPFLFIEVVFLLKNLKKIKLHKEYFRNEEK